MVRPLLCGLLACCVLACAPLVGCSKPEPPEKERKPEPQAAQASQDTELRDAIQAPIDRAKAVDGQLEEAEQRRREAIEDAGG